MTHQSCVLQYIPLIVSAIIILGSWVMVGVDSTPLSEVRDFTLTISHTNDVHARFEEASKHGGPCRQTSKRAKKCYGGVARRATAVKKIRRENEHVILLDAGDQFQGTTWFYVHKGAAAAHFMNRLGYDAMVKMTKTISLAVFMVTALQLEIFMKRNVCKVVKCL